MNFTVQRGNIEDTVQFVLFLEAVRADMPQQNWFYLDSADDVHSMMADGTMEFWMAFADKQLAAVFSILRPGLRSDNYGYDLKLCKEDLLRVIHMDTAAVHQDYRGFGLQVRLMQMAERELSGIGNRILLSTVHPENKFSLNNMLRQGYEIQTKVEKYGSERYILRKDIFLKK